jgi:hypothetical protein
MAKIEVTDKETRLTAQVKEILVPTDPSAASRGLVVFPEDAHDHHFEFLPFLNPAYGTAMNQAVTFGGTPEIIHNGGTSVEWTAAAEAGTWDFTTGGVITQAGANQNDRASFTIVTPSTIEANSYVTLTGVINLTTYAPATRDIELYFTLAGAGHGVNVSLNNYIDTGLIGTAQTFSIPVSAFGLIDNTIDALQVTNVRTGGGPKAAYTLDDITLQETGESIEFKVEAELQHELLIDSIRFQMADNVTGAAALSYNKLLGVGALSSGITFTLVIENENKFSVQLRSINDIMFLGGSIQPVILDDGTNTMLDVVITFPTPFRLVGAAARNYISITINDDLSGLLQFRASAFGHDKDHRSHS